MNEKENAIYCHELEIVRKKIEDCDSDEEIANSLLLEIMSDIKVLKILQDKSQ